MVLYSGKKGVDVTPQEHDADDKEEVGAHFREKTCGFEDLAILFVFSYRKHDERRREWRWQCQGKGCFRWREDIILRLTEKFGVVREGEMTRRESEPMQLDERGGSVIRLLLPPMGESLLLVVMAFCTIPRRRQASAPICFTSPWTSSPAIMRRRVAFPQAEGRAVS